MRRFTREGFPFMRLALLNIKSSVPHPNRTQPTSEGIPMDNPMAQVHKNAILQNIISIPTLSVKMAPAFRNGFVERVYLYRRTRLVGAAQRKYIWSTLGT